jgi:uncharacterized protein YoaH (UPF0181 family)
MMTTPILKLSGVDRDALSRCLALARTLRPELFGQPVSPRDPKLWIATAKAATYSCQIASLQLRPWDWSPCWLETDADIAAALKLPANDHTQQRRAAKIVQRLLALGLSRYEIASLQLRPWDWSPCWLETDADIAAALKLPANDHTQQRRAAKIVQRLLALGLSRYEPNPLEAIEGAEAKVLSEEGKADDRAAVSDRRYLTNRSRP